MIEDTPTSTIRRFFDEAVNDGRLSVIDEIATPDVILHSPVRPEPFHGPAAVKEYIRDIQTGFPDFQVAIDDLFSADDRVVARWHSTQQTHLGPYQGLPPTKRQITMTGVNIFRFSEGKVAEDWLMLDVAGGMRQLGVLPRAGGSPGRQALAMLGVIFRLTMLEVRNSRNRNTAA